MDNAQDNSIEDPAAPLHDSALYKPETGILPPPADAPAQTASRPRAKTDTVNIPNAGRLLSLRLAQKSGDSAERETAYRKWLATHSKEDLIELLIGFSEQPLETDSTNKISTAQVIPPRETPAESYSIPAGLAFRRLPAARKNPLAEPAPTWKIVLICLDHESDPLGLLVEGEVTVGRVVGDTMPDLDLTPFEAKTKGVSRFHARLVPTINHLMLVDNQSSNGTFWNRLRISGQTEQPLKDGDVVAFGRANFLVKIVAAPDLSAPRTLL